MQNKPNDTPKIIGLSIAIIVLLIIAAARLIPVFMAKDTTTAANPADGTSVTPAASGTPVASATGPGNSGQMRRFDDTMDTDAPVGAGMGFGGHTDAFRVIAAPVKVAEKTPTPIPTPTVKRPTTAYTNFNPAPTTQTMIQMIPAPPLEVVLDGVYQAGQERVAQLTILPKGAGKDASGKNASSASEQTVYRRVGEYIGRFKIARLTETGLALAGQRRSWTVGETEKLDEGLIRAPQAPAPVISPAQALPILLPR